MSRFVLTAQLQLQAPTNTAQIVRQIQSQLNNVQVNVQVQGTAQATRQVQQVAQSLNAANSAASNLGRTFAISVRRFAALAVATRAVSLFTNTLADATQQAIDFERQLVKLSQVTGQSLGELRGLTTTITQLATGFGVTSKSLLDVSTVLLQAGLNSRDTEVALKSLAKAALAPNFDSISETAEGAIAILAQFQEGVGALEGQLSSINAVAGAFAVEAGDLIDVIRRTGGVFKSSGGSLNELLALFTSVRATTRESAESIGTGLRTIFTRIQRPQTIEFLKQFGVELVNLEGKFVGPFEAIKLLSGALAGLGEGDLTFIRIAEELGGFRQIGKVLPLLQQFSTAQSALAVAQKANNGLTKDAETAQQALAIRITKVKEEFLALVRGITETSSFQLFANTSLNLASALIRLADALKPIIPLLTAVATIRMAQGIGGFLTGFGGGIRSNRTFNQGGKVLAFARGGMVPGTGNRDTVPAMLQPGEFVIRKSSVNKLGASNLAAMNENRFAVGGLATQNQAGIATPDTFGDDNFKSSNVSIKLADIANATPQSGPLKSGSLLSAFSNTKYISKERPNKIPAESFKSALQSAFGFASKTYIGKTAGVSQEQKTNFTNILNQEIQQAIKNGASSWSGSVGVPLSSAEVTFGQNFVLPPGVVGSFFESIVDAFEGRPIAAEAVENKRPFDFMSGLRGGANSRLFSRLSDVNYIDAKKSASLATDSEYKKKISSQLAIDGYDEVRSAVGTLYNTLISQQAATPSQSTAKTKKANLGGLIKKFALGGMAKAPLIDDIINASGTVMPRPSSAIAALVKAGGGAIDIDRTIKRTIGDKAYGMAKTAGQQSAALDKYFKDPAARLKDIKSAPLTAFGKELQAAIKSGQLQSDKLSIISKSQRVPGVAEYLSQLFGIPLANMIFTQGGSKQPAIDSLRNKGPRANRIARFAAGGGVGTDTVPALLTPGEFVVNRSSAQSIGYGNLNRMNKVGKYANGGIVQHFNSGASGSGVRAPTMVGTGGMGPGQNFIPLNMLTQQAQRLTQAQAALTTSTQTATQSQQQQRRSITETVAANKAFAASVTTSLIQGFLPAIDENSNTVLRVTHSLLGLSTIALGTAAALESLGAKLKVKTLLDFLSGQGLSTRSLASMRGGLVDAGLSKAFSTQLISVTQGLASFAGPIIAATGLFLALNYAGKSLIEAFYNYENRIKKLIESGNIEESRKLAEESQVARSRVSSGSGAVTGAALGTGAAAAIAVAFMNPFILAPLALILGTVGAGLGLLADGLSDSAGYFGQLTSTQAALIASQKSLISSSEKAAQALNEFEKGNISATQLLQSISATTAGTDRFTKESNKLAITSQKEIAREGDFGGLRGGLRNIFTLGGLLGESTGERQSRINNSSEKARKDANQQEQEALRVAQPALNALSKQIAMTNGSFDDLMIRISSTDPNLYNILIRQGTNDLNKSFQNIAKEAARTKAALEAANLGLRSAQATSTAMSASMDRFAAGLEVGGSTFVANAEFLSTAMSSAAQAMDPLEIKAAVTNVSKNLSDMGISKKYTDKFENNMNAFVSAQQNYGKAFDNIIAESKAMGTVFSADMLKDKFADQLGNMMGRDVSDEAKENFKKIIQGIELSPDEINEIMSGNYKAFGDKLTEAGKKQVEEIIQISEERNKAEQVVIGFIKQRAEAERNLAQAQKEAVDLYMEGRDIQAKYGGASVSEGEKRGAILARANAGAGAAGLTGLKTGNAAELRARNAQIFGGFRNIEAQRSVQGGMQLRAGAAADEQQKNIQQAQKDQVQTIRDLIKLEEENLKLIQEKNRLEKDSIDALISGDIDKFFEQQAASAAQGAIALGSDVLQRALGPKALGMAAQDIKRQQEAGVQELYGQRLGGPGGLTERAYGAAVGAMGVTDPRLAQIAAGTTGQEQAIQGRLQELGGILGETGALGAAMAEMQVQTATINVTNAEVKLADIERRGREAAAGMYRGGVVYANRGIFIPRGTDTVPAMLTPGEFVVRREAVQRGNNLQILQAMNRSGDAIQTATNGAIAMARGGIVRYRDQGSNNPEQAGNGFGISTEVVNRLSQSLVQFNTDLSKNIDRLNTTTFNLKLDTTNINVNLTGTSFLSQLKEDVTNKLMAFVGTEIQNYRVGSGGKLTKNTSVI